MPTPESRRELASLAREIFDINLVGAGTRDRKMQGSKFDLTDLEFRALNAISKAENPTVGDIQKQLGILPAQMSRILRSLETRGENPYVTCSINAHDRRKVDVELTDVGRKAHKAWQDARLSTIIDLMAELSEQDRNDFMRVLRRMREIMLSRLSQD